VNIVDIFLQKNVITADFFVQKNVVSQDYSLTNNILQLHLIKNHRNKIICSTQMKMCTELKLLKNKTLTANEDERMTNIV